MVNINQIIKAGTYGEVTDDATKAARSWMKGGGAGGTNVSFGQRADHFGAHFMGNLQEAAMQEGKTVLGQMGTSALKGAAWGAVGGGTISALQGGSFWDGAKQGAFNGAVGVAAYRTGMRGVGAKSLNPFKAQTATQGGGLFSAANTMWRSTSGDAGVSKQAISILNNRQQEGLARAFMNQSNKNKV